MRMSCSMKWWWVMMVNSGLWSKICSSDDGGTKKYNPDWEPGPGWWSKIMVESTRRKKVNTTIPGIYSHKSDTSDMEQWSEYFRFSVIQSALKWWQWFTWNSCLAARWVEQNSALSEAGVSLVTARGAAACCSRCSDQHFRPASAPVLRHRQVVASSSQQQPDTINTDPQQHSLQLNNLGEVYNSLLQVNCFLESYGKWLFDSNLNYFMLR